MPAPAGRAPKTIVSNAAMSLSAMFLPWDSMPEI